MPDTTIGGLFEQITLLRIIAVILVFALAWGFLVVLKYAADLLATKYSRHRLFISSAFPVVRLGLWIVTLLLVIFGIFQPPINTLIAISASVGLALGLGAQDLIKNLIAGILILIDRPFRVGDMIDAAGHYGEVIGIGLRSTRIHTFDDSIVTLPNSLVLGSAVSNSNSGELDELVVVEIRLPASVDVQQARDLAREAAVCSPYVYLKKPVAVMVGDEFQRTFLTTLKIKAYVLDVRLERLLASDITERFKREAIRCGLVTEQMVLGLVRAD